MSKPTLLVAGSLAVLWAGKALPFLPQRGLPAGQAAYAVLLTAWLGVLLGSGAFSSLGTSGPFQWRWLGFGVALGPVLFVAGGLGYATTARVLGLEPPGEAMLATDTRGWTLLALALTVVAAAGVEEWVFRGVLLDALDPLAPWVIVLVSSALFAAYHVSLFQALPTFLLGLGLGALVLGTGALWPAVVAHASYNLLGVVALVSR